MKKGNLLLLIVAVAFSSNSFAQLNEGFETWPPTDWTIIQGACSPTNDITQNNSYAYSGTYSARFSSMSSCNNYSEYLITPQLSTTSGDQTITFWYRKYTIGNEKFKVGWSSTGTNVSTDFTWSAEITNASTTWQQFSKTDLPVGTKYVAIHYYSSYDYYLYIDDFTGPSIYVPTCPDPTAQTETNITITSANLGWTENGTATTYEIEWGPTGFTQGTGTMLTGITTNPYPLSGLTANTSYDWYVRADCGGGDYSNWIGESTFSTSCYAITTFPFSEGFNSGSTTKSCWTILNENGDGDSWNMNYLISTYEGDMCATMNTDGNSGNNNDYLISPQLTLPVNQQLSFWYRVRSSSEPNDFEVLLSTTGNSPADFTTTLVANASYSNVSYQEMLVDLSSYSGNIYIAWHIPTGGLDGWILYIDYVNISDIPTCPASTTQTETNLLATSVDLGWTENGSATTWEIEWGPTGFTQGTGTMLTGITTNPYTLSGLTANTSYDWYVRADCGGGDYSNWDGASSFTTTCAIVTTLSEDFTSFSTPLCWGNTGSESWLFNTNAAYGANAADDHTVGGGTNYAWIDGSGGIGTNELLTPYADVSGFTAPAFQFYYFSNNTDNPGDDNTLIVDFWDGAAWNTLLTYSGDNASWQQGLYDLSGYTITGNVQFRFSVTGTANTTYYNDILLDDVSIIEYPSCMNPTAQTETNITVTSANLDWSETGTATTYEIEWGSAGFTQGSGTIITGITTKPYSLSGLTGNTSYDWYVRADCGSGDYSNWIGVSTFTTLCGIYTPDYYEYFTNFMPDCWDQNKGPVTGPTSIPGNSYWYEDGFGNNGFSGSARINLYSTGRQEWLITPNFDLTGGGFELNFDLAVTAFSGTASSNMGSDDQVQLLMTTDGGTTWNNLSTWDINNTPSDTGDNITVNINIYTQNPVQFAFWASDGTVNDSEDYNFYVDNFQVRTPNSCPDPTTLTENNETPTGADLAWTDATGTHWDLYIIPTGDPAPTTGSTPTINDTQTNPYTWTGGSGITTYDWYVRSDCGQNNTNTSSWTGIGSFTTSLFCSAPSAQTETNITSNSADLGWSGNKTSTTYEVEWGPAGFIPGTGTIITGIMNTIYHICGLSPFTNYEWYVRKDCGGGNKSDWTGPKQFTTQCETPTIQTVSNETASGADLAWADIYGSDWDLYIVPTGNPAPTSVTTPTINTQNNPYTWTGGSPATTYDWYVRSNCGSGNYSNWAGPGMFTTSACVNPISGTVTNISCFGNADGIVNITLSGGMSPLYYAWSNGAANLIISGLSAGVYSITVTDANNCVSVESYTVTEPDVISVSEAITNVLCNGDPTGQIALTVSGGTQPYSYTWSNGAASQNISALILGTYNLTVTDANGCEFMASYAVTEPDAISVTITITDVLCNGENTGAIDLSVSGGVLPYSYVWSNGEASQNISGLIAGTYSVTVTDANSCVSTASCNVIEPTALSVTGSITNVLCYGENTGAINLAVSGGTQPYLYSWSNGAASQNISELILGTYSVTVSDNNNCEFITGYSVTEPAILSLVLSSTNLSCFESNDGAVSSAVTGGIAPYTWLWSNSETSQNIDQLATGTFSVIVTDTNACSVSGELSITQPPELFVDIGPDLIIDEGTVDTLTATSGFTNYLWNTGETTMSITVSTEGYYSVTVTDSQGCTASDEMHLSVNLFNMQGIILIQGWSIFSLNISPIILPIDTLMADVVINVALVKNSFGHVWWPYFNMNQIGNHVIGEGYQAKMFFTDTLYAEGPVIVPENTPLNLLAGWSIIAYLRQQPANTEVLMSTIENSIILMKNSSGHTYWPFFNINDIGNMMPGEGYQIKLFSSVIYTYPPNSVNINKAVMVNRKTINYIFDINTGNNMTIGIPISSWSATPEIGDEIGIFTKYGELAGSSVYSGNNLSITIWGDDIITDKQELFADGENFEIRLWNKQSGLEKVLDVSWTEGSGRYSENGIAVVNKVLIAISSKFSLNNYPNPFKEICIIEFNIPENGNVRIELFNAIGEKLEMITNKEYPAGQHELQFNVGSLSVGNYFIRLETNGNTVNKAVQIIK